MENIRLGDLIGKILGRREGEKREGKSTSSPEYSLKPQASTPPEKIYIKAWVLKSLEELDSIKEEVLSGNIMILRLGKLAEKNMEDVKKAVNELYDFTQQIDGDIARLGEERIVVTPPFVKIWRRKTST